MKRIVAAVSLLTALSVCVPAENIVEIPSGWVLDWSEDFNGSQIDTTVWSKCQRSTSDWSNTMSDDERLFEVRDGLLLLRGIVNPDTIVDKSPYLTGGLETKYKKSFSPGRMEVRARLHGAKGAWPAIWMLPFDRVKGWPHDGEVDIMERLNHDAFIYQTVHSNYTFILKNTDNPTSSVRSVFNPEDFNVFGAEIYPDKVVFLLNGEVTTEYPIIEDKSDDGQFPYYQPMYLLIDMQLGGSWVGEVDPDELPVEMEVDWVRHYIKE